MVDVKKVQENISTLVDLYKSGALGGEKMPEDENPGLDVHSQENSLFFTLPMALNYQRNSYKLWESANQTYQDMPTRGCFSPQAVVEMPTERLRDTLFKYKLAIQSNKQPDIWRRLCLTIHQEFGDDIRNLFIEQGFSVTKIKDFIAGNKSRFPYLGGKKILNYWLYVLEKYTDAHFLDRDNITIAPDTHVMQASCKLGVIEEGELGRQDIQDVVAARWQEILEETKFCPIDVHTPLWLWSRGRFAIQI